MKTISLASAAAVLVILVTACSSSDGASSGGTSAGTSVSGFATSLCGYLSKCSPASIEAGYGDVAGCTSEITAQFNVNKGLQGTSFTQSQIDACAAKVGSLSCDLDINDVPECDFPGTLAAGAACAEDSQCASAFCAVDASNATTATGINASCGKCAERADVGGPCTDDGVCKAGLACDNTTNKCATRPAKGAACTEALSCTPGLKCVKAVCADPVPLGGACSADADECAAPLGCDGTKCADTSSQVTVVALGATCGIDQTAQKFLVCKQASCAGAAGAQKCVPYAALGAACDPEGGGTSADCDPNASCNPTSKTCVKADPAACK